MVFLKPELNDPKYYIHLLVISVVVVFLLKMFVTPLEFSLLSIIKIAVFVGIADIIAHTILRLN